MKISKESTTGKILKKVIPILKLVILLSVVIGTPIYVYFYYPDLIENFRSLESINNFLSRYQTASIFVYIGLQIIQVIISVLPGQALQFAAGYAFNFWLGYLYSMIGVALGTIITFYLARILGKDGMHLIFGEERITKFVRILNSKRAYTLLFFLFLIPGIPKDLFTYAAGVSEIKVKSFIAISLVGRTPAMMGSIMMGRMFYTGSYIGLIIMGIVALIAFVAIVLKREKIMEWTDRSYEKLNKSK